MAVDTRDKRGSVLGLGLAALLVLPQPTALDQGDRQQVAYCYRGIAAGAPTAQITYDVAVDGTYLPSLALDGTYLPAVTLDGTYRPTVTLDGHAGS